METLQHKPGTKRPVIVRAATALFARQGIDATSMREIAAAAGVREAAIYRHFTGKDALAREIFVSWYGWYCSRLQRIVNGPGSTFDKLRAIVRHEFTAASDHGEAFVYFCENEARFARALPSEMVTVRRLFEALIKSGQSRGELSAASPLLLADMLSGALCAVALVWQRSGRRGKLDGQYDRIVQHCWRMISA